MQHRIRRRYRFRPYGILRFILLILIIVFVIFLLANITKTDEPKESEIITLRSSQKGLIKSTDNAEPSETAKPKRESFIGNSQIEDLFISGLYPNADYYGKAGLNVRSVFYTPTDGSTEPVTDAVTAKDYTDVYFLFGLNELGWESWDIFIRDYSKLIRFVRKSCPNAQIYVISILPVSEHVSEQNRNGVSQDAVNEMNCRLIDMAAESGAHYLNFSPKLRDATGFLPDEASADGIHLNKQYTEKLVNMIKNKEDYIW